MLHSYLNRRMHLLAAATALALATAPVYAGKVSLSGLKSGETYSQFIVKYKTGSAPALQAAAVNSSLASVSARTVLSPGSKGKIIDLKRQQRNSIGGDVVINGSPLNAQDAAALMQQIAADPNVEYVEPNLSLRGLSIPNDPRFSEQWHYANSAVGINAPAAWDVTNGSGVVVAVIDSGILSHADLNANVLPGYNMISSFWSFRPDKGRTNNPADEEGSNYHGTHVAGTIGAIGNNGIGVTGVAYGAKIVPIRVLDKNSNGTLDDIADAITWASGGNVSGIPKNPNPAKVINLSVGGNAQCSYTMQSAINAAVSRGSIIIVAAGNSNNDVAGTIPAGCDNVVSVAASDRIGNRAYYSTWGAKITVTAPGGEVCSPPTEFLPLNASPKGTCTEARFPENGVLSTVSNNGYESMPWQGSSMAAPHVAGIAALIVWASKTPKTPAQIKQILTTTARPIAAAKCPGGCGAGLVDAAAAVNAAK